MYNTVIILHSVLRWIILFSGVFVVVRAAGALMSPRPWQRTDKQAALGFVISMDVQLLLGLLLFLGLSPLVNFARESGMATVMKTRVLRFYTVEHTLGMFLALLLVHVGWVLAKRSASDAQRFRRVAWFFGIALLLILGSIPWPFLPVIGRPFFHF